MMVIVLTNLQESKTALSDSLSVFQSDRSRRGEPDDDPERGYRVRPNFAAAGDRDGQYGGSYGLSEPDCRTHPSRVREHFWEVEHENQSREHNARSLTSHIHRTNTNHCCGPSLKVYITNVSGFTVTYDRI